MHEQCEFNMGLHNIGNWNVPLYEFTTGILLLSS